MFRRWWDRIEKGFIIKVDRLRSRRWAAFLIFNFFLGSQHKKKLLDRLSVIPLIIEELMVYYHVINTEYWQKKSVTILAMISRYFKVTQLKSTIALPLKKKNAMRTLGLTRRLQTVYHKITPQEAGQIAIVKELVKVELSPIKKSRKEMRLERKSKPGFTIINRRH